MPSGTFLDDLNQSYVVHVLFLRHAQGLETRWVEGLLPAAGLGLQGEFQIHVTAYPSVADRRCWGVLVTGEVTGSPQDCFSYLRSLTSPVGIQYGFDPLAAKYYCRPASGFIEEVQAEADSQESAQKPSLR